MTKTEGTKRKYRKWPSFVSSLINQVEEIYSYFEFHKKYQLREENKIKKSVFKR